MRYLTMQTTQQEVLRKRLNDAETASQDSEKTLNSRIMELEESLSRREERVHALELDISKLRKESETHQALSKTSETKFEELEKEHEALKESTSSSPETDALQAQLDEIRKEKEVLKTAKVDLANQLSAATTTTEELEREIQGLKLESTSISGKHESRAQELHSRTTTLQAENQSLLSQLSELRGHLISVQDEKFALRESIERLQKDLKEARSLKPSYKNSSELSRPRVSKDFDKSANMQEISLNEKQAQTRDPKDPPMDLQNNIQIDLTSWYDKHAGEVIEV